MKCDCTPLLLVLRPNVSASAFSFFLFSRSRLRADGCRVWWRLIKTGVCVTALCVTALCVTALCVTALVKASWPVMVGELKRRPLSKRQPPSVHSSLSAQQEFELQKADCSSFSHEHPGVMPRLPRPPSLHPAPPCLTAVMTQFPLWRAGP